jgi:hypothetical protein
MPEDDCPSGDYFDVVSEEPLAVGMLVGGAGIGALIGRGIRVERWRRVAPPWSRAAARRSAGEQRVLAVRLPLRALSPPARSGGAAVAAG